MNTLNNVLPFFPFLSRPGMHGHLWKLTISFTFYIFFTVGIVKVICLNPIQALVFPFCLDMCSTLKPLLQEAFFVLTKILEHHSTIAS